MLQLLCRELQYSLIHMNKSMLQLPAQQEAGSLARQGNTVKELKHLARVAACSL